MKTARIRSIFLDFFKARGHTLVKSDSLIPKGDPTLLFTGAGMNQFKDYFLGVRKDLKRATSSQKCVRTGDLDVVGKTPYHHSFFEMLGNFSFGDYFKREAIEWAWEFLTKELGISKDHLFVSVHEKDEEALRLWVDHIGIPEKLIARLDDHTNFWPADAPKLGPNGPCGPCSEIYFDQGKNYPGSRKGFWADDESGRFAEIWNLVFTQFERHADGSLPPLKAQNIDTGMGLERLACVMQGKKSNFEIDIFAPLVSHLKNRVSKSRPVSMENLNAIADHVRAAVVAISDGAHPSNESRGYVIRKLIRRSIWKGRAMNLSAPILAPMVSLIVKSLEDTYPELRQNEKSIYESISSEEARFNETLESGLEMITKLIKEAKKRKSRLLSGEEVFQLYDTFGFPDELTRTIASESGISLDEKQFLTLLDEQRKRAKKASKLADTIFASSDLNQELLKLPASQFLGYKTTKADGTVLWENFSGNNGALVLDQTPFYPEGGGQVGDVGLIEGSKFTFQVEDTQKKDLVIVHTGHLLKGKPKVKNKCKTSVDPSSREATKRNHTATHLLQSALRAVVGTHVRQVGSLVNPEKLRFDFTHGRPLTQEQIAATEKWVNEAVLESESVDAKQENYDAALKTGALAFFGDKYSDRVRTINIKGRSKELCGGTHCQNTGEIGGFLITSESSVGSGTRRLEAITGLNTIHYTKSIQSQLQQVATSLKSAPDQILSRIGKMQQRIRELERGASTTGHRQDAIDVEQIIQTAKAVGPVQLIRHNAKDVALPMLRSLADKIRGKSKKSVIALFSEKDAKVNLIIALTRDLNNSPIDAKVLAQKIAPLVDGSAGGRKDLAQGGGRRTNGIPTAIDALPKLISDAEGQ